MNKNKNARLEPGATYQNSHSNFKRFPAFGKQLDDLRKEGAIPALLPIMVVFNWSLAKSFPRVVIDRSIKPSSYAFDFLAGLSVQICVDDSDLHLVDDLVREITKSKPAEIVLFRFDLVGSGTPAFAMLYQLEKARGAA